MTERLENDTNTKSQSLMSEPVIAAQSPLLFNQLAVVGKGIRHNNVLLPHLLQADIQRWYPWSGVKYVLNAQLLKWLPAQKNQLLSPLPQAFVGWGHKKSYQRADKAAKKQQLSTLSIEDGFLRSLDSGTSSRHGLSVVVDDIGIYFDLTQSSRLEQLIIERTKNATIDNSGADEERAQQLMARICNEKISKYNAVIDCPLLNELVGQEHPYTLKTPLKSHILLIDQVAGDASVRGAGANKRQFKRMLKAACRNHPDSHIWIKAHPASKTGYLTSFKLPKNVRLLTQSLNPIALMAQVEHVYTVSSHMGFEALMLGKKVHCFGVNWYSGWGLTDDSGAPKHLLKEVERRRGMLAKASVNTKKKPGLLLFSTASSKRFNTTLEMLFHSAYIDYSHYVDPATKQACAIDAAIDWLVTNRHWQLRLEGDLTIYEFSRWKLPFVKDFINLPRTTLFIKPKPRLKNLLHPDHFRVNYQRPSLVWGLAKRQQVQQKRQKKLAVQPSEMPSIYCMEDGFIRSNGLGATLLAPLSVVIDKQGIYYDATQPSDLETLLCNCETLNPYQNTRVKLLQEKLLTQRVSKYNVGADANNSDSQHSLWMQKAKLSGKHRILIIGQVEDDLSVQYCGSTIKTNSGLIDRVCQDNPDAYLIYKPHPDVEAGLRAGKVAEAGLRQVNAVAYDTAMPDCLECIDEVHTISSLTGFEALLRGLQVTCYGLPFYAGWGLTTDIDAKLSPKSEYLERRKRDTVLTLEQLLHCVLICYPLYRLPNGYGLAQVEQVIDYLYPLKNEHRPEDSCSQGSQTTTPSNIDRSIQTSNSVVSTLTTQIKRHAAIRFMQQRHRFQQLVRKVSR
ncbi:capsular polysaccharide biosynthesis protein [Psychrobacter sp. NZS113]|uniref:capsular polysaccharide biosynthesis protein n=1 Tax=Psychrobacter sp. NZS113 TaxID=2792045 RepID=UPI001D104754|nr:capsular polysaccharide biosynthesis protein [Psychrobacter sp. NZS113]